MRLLISSLVICIIAWTNTVQAGLIVFPPSPTTDPQSKYLFDSTTYTPDTVREVGSGFQGKFFGNVISGSIFASENGNINFSTTGSSTFTGDGSIAPIPDPDKPYYPNSTSGRPGRIMAFWDDILYVTGTTARIIEYYVPGHFLSVTWSRVLLDFDQYATTPVTSTERSAQLVWFEGDTTIGVYDFKAGDIAIGHVGHVAGTSNFGEYVYAFMGLDSGSGSIVTTSSNPGGFFTNDSGYYGIDTVGQLAWQADNFYLFRPTASGTSYGVTLENIALNSSTAIPEPSSLVLVGLAIGGAAWRWNRKRLDRSRANQADHSES